LNLSEIVKVFKEIEKEPSRTGKELILKNNEGNTEFREALSFLLNPYIVTGVSTKKMRKKIPVKTKAKLADKVHKISTFKEAIEYIKRHNSGRDVDILAIKGFIESVVTGDERLFIEKFFTKDLKLGISSKTVNKVYGKGTIPQFEVMLAKSFKDEHEKIEGDFYVTLKLDGNRCIAIVDGSGVKFFTRQGKPILDMVELDSQFRSFPQGVYDGELLLINKDNLPSDKLFRATQKVVRKDGEKKDLEFHIFDFVSISEFEDGISKRTYAQRRNTLDMVITPYTQNEGCMISVLPVLYSGNDKSVIPVLMKEVENQGFEGLMINTGDGLYQATRSSNLLKVKTMKTADLLVMSVERAIDGQFEGLLGRVNVEYKGNLVGVGSGFTIEQRREFIDNPDLICGKIIEVQFFEESKDEKTGMPSLRFPVFKGIRDDKNVEDVNYGE
ncbi:ATP-dependent DNA ligase, partial [Bacillus subtilis]